MYMHIHIYSVAEWALYEASYVLGPCLLHHCFCSLILSLSMRAGGIPWSLCYYYDVIAIAKSEEFNGVDVFLRLAHEYAWDVGLTATGLTNHIPNMAIIKGPKCCWWRIHSCNPPHQQRPVAIQWKNCIVDHCHVGLRWGTRQNASHHNDDLGITS